MKRGTLVVVLVLAACSAPAPDPTPRPTPEPAGYTDAEQTALLLDSIDIVYCGSEPVAEWCPTIRDVAVEDGWAYVITSNPDMAESICTAIAAATYDDNAEPIGVTDVMVGGLDSEPITDCDVLPMP